MSNQHTALIWRDTPLGAVPIATQFDDPYYSLDNGLAETEHVFIAGNDLYSRFQSPLHIGELGFGTGLNLLTTLRARQRTTDPAPLRFTSFEGFPLTADQARQALAAFPDLTNLAEPLLDHWDGAMQGRVTPWPDVKLQVITGDVRETLPAWTGAADAWFLDGFSPAKNPAMWAPEVMQAVADHTASHGTLATYTAAGHVRRSLEQAGFTITRAPGFGRKRHMTRGVKDT